MYFAALSHGTECHRTGWDPKLGTRIPENGALVLVVSYKTLAVGQEAWILLGREWGSCAQFLNGNF